LVVDCILTIFGIDLAFSRATMRLFTLFTALLLVASANAADSTLRYENYIYEKDFRSVKLYQTNSGFNFPILMLNGGETLSLDFDQLTSEQDYYQYTLIHCNADWQPSGIAKTQTLSGMGFENINNAMFSSATLMQYTHYSITIPGENTTPKISGNYLLVLYRNFNDKDIVISRRIMVLDSKGGLDMNVIQSSQVELRPTHQEVDFSFVLNNSSYNIPNPYKDLKAVIIRNGEWMETISDLKPQFITGNTYNYNYQTGNQFEGMNEYRFFDIRSYRLSTAGVKQRFNVAGQKHIVLIVDQTRRFDRYSRWADYNGRYLLQNKDIPNAGNAPMESDYCFVHFSVKSEEELKNKKVYIYGELSDWRMMDDFQCYYNADNKTYEAVVPLKQAYYNYVYAVVDNVTGEVDTKPFEGSHCETENNYMVLMYHKNQTMGFDELIGYGLKNMYEK
jgi:Domain of unknown function (DUF5103)